MELETEVVAYTDDKEMGWNVLDNAINIQGHLL
jgi:hypothetical protein